LATIRVVFVLDTRLRVFTVRDLLAVGVLAIFTVVRHANVKELVFERTDSVHDDAREFFRRRSHTQQLPGKGRSFNFLAVRTVNEITAVGKYRADNKNDVIKATAISAGIGKSSCRGPKTISRRSERTTAAEKRTLRPKRRRRPPSYFSFEIWRAATAFRGLHTSPIVTARFSTLAVDVRLSGRRPKRARPFRRFSIFFIPFPSRSLYGNGPNPTLKQRAGSFHTLLTDVTTENGRARCRHGVGGETVSLDPSTPPPLERLAAATSGRRGRALTSRGPIPPCVTPVVVELERQYRWTTVLGRLPVRSRRGDRRSPAPVPVSGPAMDGKIKKLYKIVLTGGKRNNFSTLRLAPATRCVPRHEVSRW